MNEVKKPVKLVLPNSDTYFGYIKGVRWQYINKEIPVKSDYAPREKDTLQFVIPSDWKLVGVESKSRLEPNFEIVDGKGYKVLEMKHVNGGERAVFDENKPIFLITKREGWGNDGSDIYKVRLSNKEDGQYFYGLFVGRYQKEDGSFTISDYVSIMPDQGASEGVAQSYRINFAYTGPDAEKYLAIADRIVSLMWLR